MGVEVSPEEFVRRMDLLPEAFQKRLQYFREVEGWEKEFGPYELFVCEEAAKLVKAFSTEEELKEFNSLPYERQKKVSDERKIELELEQHSGNTFGQAVFLARVFLVKPEVLQMHHGALCPLVGCRAYGCYAFREAQEAHEGAKTSSLCKDTKEGPTS